MRALLQGRTVARAMADGANNFAHLRLILAAAVIVSHGFSMGTGRHADEPLTLATGFTLGEHAVNGFFAISGFLVTMSFVSRGWRDYLIARVLRIAPAFVAAVIAVGFVLGPLMTSLPVGAYLTDQALWRFVSATLTTFKTALALPGVFAGNPTPIPMGTVWTLKYETICYGGVLAAGLVGALSSRILAALVPVGLFTALAYVEATQAPVSKGLETALRLPLVFTVGGALYLLRDHARLSALAVIALLGAAVTAEGTVLYKPLVFFATAYGVIWFAFLPIPVLSRIEPPFDVSYGLYLWGWPVQQAIQSLAPHLAPAPAIVLAVLVTTPIALASWYLVEKPALALKARLMGQGATAASDVRVS